jgi:hypothetical protein
MGQSPPLLIQGAIGGEVQYLHLRVRLIAICPASNQWNSESTPLRPALRGAFGWARAQAGSEV